MGDDFGALYAIFNLKHSIETLQLLVEQGEHRFSEIERKIDASSDVTSRVLDLLCETGLVARKETNPRTVHYTATEKGERFLDTVQDLQSELQK